MGPSSFFRRLEAKSRPRLQASYRDWMWQVARVDRALSLVSDLGLYWCLSNNPQWQAYRVEPYTPNQAVLFDARGRVGFTGVDLLEQGRAREVLTVGSFPPEVVRNCMSPSSGAGLPQSLEQLIDRMVQAFPVLCEVFNNARNCEVLHR